MRFLDFRKKVKTKLHEGEEFLDEGTRFTQNEVLSIKKSIKKRVLKQKYLHTGVVIFGITSILFFLTTAYYRHEVQVISLNESVSQSGSLPRNVHTGEEVIQALSRHILVPEGNPQIAEVKEAARLKETQSFFKNAENGDIVIAYETTIFLYRPSRDLVIASGDISGLGQTKP